MPPAVTLSLTRRVMRFLLYFRTAAPLAGMVVGGLVVMWTLDGARGGLVRLLVHRAGRGGDGERVLELGIDVHAAVPRGRSLRGCSIPLPRVTAPDP